MIPWFLTHPSGIFLHQDLVQPESERFDMQYDLKVSCGCDIHGSTCPDKFMLVDTVHLLLVGVIGFAPDREHWARSDVSLAQINVLLCNG